MMTRSALCIFDPEDQSLAQPLVRYFRNRTMFGRLEAQPIEAGSSILEKPGVVGDTVDCLIVLLSPASVASRWVREEVGLVLQDGVDGRRLTVIMVRIADCTVPKWLGDVACIFDMRSTADYHTGLEEIVHFLGRSAQAKTIRSHLAAPHENGEEAADGYLSINPAPAMVARRPDPAAAERHISVWVGADDLEPPKSLLLNETYTLNFKVGQVVGRSLVGGPETLVPAADIPPGGLQTRWVVTSSAVEFAAVSPDTVISETTAEGARVWTAAFSLVIPEDGDSEVPQLSITPRVVGDADLQILIYVGAELYRHLAVQLAVSAGLASSAGFLGAAGPAAVRRDLTYTPAAQTNLKAPHEWATPPGQTSVAILGQFAIISGEDGSRHLGPQTIPWSGVQAQVGGPIKNVRAAAENFRARWEAYLDDIDPGELAQRISDWTPECDWSALRDFSDKPHRDAWNAASISPELRNFAYDGHELYQSFFPPASPLRAWLDSLTPGHRLDISWTPTANPGWMPHIPWGLMYLPELPTNGAPVDPMGFLALRFRLGYTAHEVQVGSKALGRLADTHVGHFLYWGDQPQDPTGVEASWQRREWTTMQNQIFIPSSTAGANCKQELIACLDDPTPMPMSLLYFFCQCAVGAGNDPVLRFGSSAQITEVVGRTELGTRKLADQPLVFANACTTSTSDPYIANELEKGFFNRGSRAYLGTEAKVPIKLASRFAHLFFHFFWRRFGYFDSENPPKPMAAGEAVAQTRLFLWTQYRNIGGLFYTYVNQYELFMASDADLDQLRN
ncbi:MAG: toll/interleukin-1 receptor domain-containing protein [Desulfobacterales bacterium]